VVSNKMWCRLWCLLSCVDYLNGKLT